MFAHAHFHVGVSQKILKLKKNLIMLIRNLEVTLDSSLLLISSIHSATDSAVYLKLSVSTSHLSHCLCVRQALITSCHDSCKSVLSIVFFPPVFASVQSVQHKAFKVILFKSVSVSVENPSKSLHCFQYEMEASPL